MLIWFTPACSKGVKEEASSATRSNKTKGKSKGGDVIIQDALSGKWYSSDRDSLTTEIKRYIDKAKEKTFEKKVQMGLVPHAGLLYSGPVAAYTYKAFMGRHIDTVIILGIFHRFYADYVFLPSSGEVKTPLGSIKIDEEATDYLSNYSCFGFTEGILSQLNSYGENSLELNFPFIKYSFPEAKVVPIYFSHASKEDREMVAHAIASYMKETKKEVIVLLSSDLSHFNHASIAERKDKATLEGVLDGDVKKWYNDVERTEGACGRDPISTGMMIAKELGLKPEILHYAHSGDVTGDTTQVVGYGSIVWTGDVEKKKPTVDSTGSMDVPKDVRKKMLVYVRKAITEYVVNGKRLKIEDKEPIWDEKVGLFVTLKKNEDLRGCIGFIEGVATLRETLVEMAISASTKDPRFESVTKDEIDNLSIEISVLSPLYLVKDIDEIKVGRDGLIIKRGFYQGLLLPQVATEYNWNREEFLSHTCEKAGLPRDAWKDKKSEIRRFSATVFSEESEGITR